MRFVKPYDQKLNNILAEQRKVYERYLGVVAERFESQLKLIAESMAGMQEQLVGIRDMVAKNTEDLEMIKMESHLMRRDMKSMVHRDEFEVLEKRIAKLEKLIPHAQR